jgi:hypothetical protein
MKKSILLLFLGLNTLMQLAGGSLMLSAPAKAARDIFAVAAPVSTADERLVSVIGAATLSFALITGTALIWSWRGRRSGFDLALISGLVLIMIGVALLASGTSAGGIDVAKGVAIALAAWFARPRALQSAMTAADRAAAPSSSRLRAS